MQIAFVYDSVHPWETGGVQTRIWELARRLVDSHDIHWYGLHYWDGPPVIEREGVILHGVAPEQDLYVNGRRSISEALRFSAALAKPLLNADPDIIDCQAFPYFPSFPSKLQSLIRGSTLLITWHEVWNNYWYEYLGRKGIFGKAIERILTQLPDEHAVVSERTRRDLAAIGVQGSQFVPNGVDTASIEAVAATDEPVDVFFAGRLIPEKNPDLVVRAIDALRETWPDVQGVLAGAGPERERVQGLVESRGLADAVRLPGFLEMHENVLAHMAAADVLLLPSQREGFGITVLEALASGTPVVTIEHPQNAAKELVTDDETGYVVDPDPNALADAVLRVRETIDPAACVRAARDYDWDRVAERAEATYCDAMEST